MSELLPILKSASNYAYKLTPKRLTLLFAKKKQFSGIRVFFTIFFCLIIFVLYFFYRGSLPFKNGTKP